MEPIKKVIDKMAKDATKVRAGLPGEPVWEKHFSCNDYYGLRIELNKSTMFVGGSYFTDLSPEYMEEYLKKSQAMMDTVRYALEKHREFFGK